MKVYLKDKKTLVIEANGKKTEVSFRRKGKFTHKMRLKIENKK